MKSHPFFNDSAVRSMVADRAIYLRTKYENVNRLSQLAILDGDFDAADTLDYAAQRIYGAFQALRSFLYRYPNR